MVLRRVQLPSLDRLWQRDDGQGDDRAAGRLDRGGHRHGRRRRWRTTETLGATETAYVPAGCVQDGFGNFNGDPSGRVGGTGAVGERNACGAVRLPGLSINNVRVDEGNEGTKNATFDVGSPPSGAPRSRSTLRPRDGTAKAGSDYEQTSGKLTFPARSGNRTAAEVTKSIQVKVNGDLGDEPDEGFVLNLSNASGATLTDTRARRRSWTTTWRRPPPAAGRAEGPGGGGGTSPARARRRRQRYREGHRAGAPVAVRPAHRTRRGRRLGKAKLGGRRTGPPQGAPRAAQAATLDGPLLHGQAPPSHRLCLGTAASEARPLAPRPGGEARRADHGVPPGLLDQRREAGLLAASSSGGWRGPASFRESAPPLAHRARRGLPARLQGAGPAACGRSASPTCTSPAAAWRFA